LRQTHKHTEGLKRLMGSLYNWISNENTDIKK
jgi:hypothetical protein